MPESARILQSFKGHWTNVRQTILVLSWIAITVTSAIGQSKFDIDTPGLLVEATIGWGGVADRSVPLPLAFHFRNDTDRNLVGRLIVSDKTSGYQIDLGEVVVSPGTARRLTSIQKMTEWYDAVATLYDGGRILWRRDLALLTGNMFDANLNYLLFIDEGGRRFQIPGDLATDPNAARSQGQQMPAGTNGRSVRCLTVKPWQLVNHPGALIVAQAMVFAEGTTERDLNHAQWEAVAKWMCQGGAVFMPSSARESIDRLIASSPLDLDPENQIGTLRNRRCGLGSLYEYSGPLMTTEGEPLRGEIAQTVAKISKNQINTFADNRYFQPQGRSNTESKRNSLLIVGLFSAYTLLSGLVTILLFRLNQKRITIYITTVVLITSVCAVLLGGYLRMTKGDLRWVTLTQAGSGGLVQVGTIEVQSAGGRNAVVTVTGDNVDLQSLGKSGPMYGYWSTQPFGYSPFSWQPSLDPTDKNAYQIRVAMSPWGRRRCHAMAFHRESERVEFDIQFEPFSQSNGAGNLDQGAINGLFKIKIENRLPFALKNCWLVIGTVEEEISNNGNAQRRLANRNRQNQRYYEVIDGLWDVYHLENVGSFDPRIPRNVEFNAKFETPAQNWNFMRNWPYGSQIPPRLSQIGRNQAWIIGEISDSPIINIDESRTDFIPAENTAHLFVQEVPTEDLPIALDLTTRRQASSQEPVSAQQPSNN